jgi:hypothetical protein
MDVDLRESEKPEHVTSMRDFATNSQIAPQAWQSMINSEYIPMDPGSCELHWTRTDRNQPIWTVNRNNGQLPRCFADGHAGHPTGHPTPYLYPGGLMGSLCGVIFVPHGASWEAKYCFQYDRRADASQTSDLHVIRLPSNVSGPARVLFFINDDYRNGPDKYHDNDGLLNHTVVVGGRNSARHDLGALPFQGW